MNDFGNISDFLYTILYADDTSVLLYGNNLFNLIKFLNSELEKLSIWLKSNKLTFNVITIDNVCLQRTDSFKYLGVIINHKLNWTQHIDYVKNKISKGIGIMYRARNCLTKKSLLNLYYSYIYPYLIYCIEIWGISPQTHLNPLLLMQKKRIRIMTFTSYHAHTAPIFRDLEI